jgi:hypothetical protein
MDWLTFFSKVIGSLAWPALVGVGVVIFRRELGRLISYVSEVRWSKSGGLRIRFEIEKAQQQAQAIGVVAPQYDYLLTPGIERDPFLGLIKTFPEMGILVSWGDVEKAVWELWKKHPKLNGHYLHLIGTIDWQMLDGIVDRETLGLAKRLHRIRNEAAHNRDVGLTAAEAVEYRVMTQAVAKRIREFGEQIQG